MYMNYFHHFSSFIGGCIFDFFLQFEYENWSEVKKSISPKNKHNFRVLKVNDEENKLNNKLNNLSATIHLKRNSKRILPSLKEKNQHRKPNMYVYAYILIKIFTNINYLRASNMKLHKLLALFFFFLSTFFLQLVSISSADFFSVIISSGIGIEEGESA